MVDGNNLLSRHTSTLRHLCAPQNIYFTRLFDPQNINDNISPCTRFSIARFICRRRRASSENESYPTPRDFGLPDLGEELINAEAEQRKGFDQSRDHGTDQQDCEGRPPVNFITTYREKEADEEEEMFYDELYKMELQLTESFQLKQNHARILQDQCDSLGVFLKL